MQQGEIFEQALKAGTQCEECHPGMDKLREFTVLFAGEIDQAVSKVSRCKVLYVMTNVCAYYWVV